MLWNCVDVRDVARAHRLCIETVKDRWVVTFSRPQIETANSSWELQALLSSLFPTVAEIGGEPMVTAFSEGYL